MIIPKHIVLQDVMEHAVNKFKKNILCMLHGLLKHMYDCSDSLPSFMCCVQLNNQNHFSITVTAVPCLTL